MQPSTGYEPTSGNPGLPNATLAIQMDVDTSVSGLTNPMASTTPTQPSQSTIVGVGPHHGAPQMPFQTNYSGEATSMVANSSTSNQLIPLQVNVNFQDQPKNGSPDKSDLKNEIALLRQHMVQLNTEFFQAQMTAAQNSCNESQFKQRAAEVMARFEATTAQAEDMWNQAHEVSMGRQQAASSAQIVQIRNEATLHIAKLTEKLDETE